MKDILNVADEWLKAGRSFAIARVMTTWGSSPRPSGSMLLVAEDGTMAGSVSGGCVEGAVVKAARQVINDGQAQRLSFGVADEVAWSFGLTCGGSLSVWVERAPVGPDALLVWTNLINTIRQNQFCLWCTRLEEDSVSSLWLGDTNEENEHLPMDVRMKARQLLHARRPGAEVSEDGNWMLQVFPQRSQLLIIGASHLTADLVQLASAFDFETIVIDPRGAFADHTTFAQAPDRIFTAYPSEVLNQFSLDESCFAVVLSHDPKIDDNALQILLRKKPAYIGALGSKATHEKRKGRLASAGFTDAEISRIESPIGVNIGAVGAREIALSIMGSLVRARNGKP
jgi:xanthine dehydrogenase accessory factor